MPFTPFHFGLGMLAKGCSPRHVWLTAFVLPNVLVDCEVLYYMRIHQGPLHRFWHTCIGGTLAGLAGGVLMFVAWQVVMRLASPRWPWLERLRAASRRRLLLEALAAGFAGGVSHVFLDSLMHYDMNPLWPVVQGNPLAGCVDVGMLHGGLATAGLLGAVLWLFLREI
jgi:hypothetical protein